MFDLFSRKGDYQRYMAEFETGDKRKEVSDSSLASYKEASDNANELPPTNPIRLGEVVVSGNVIKITKARA